MKIFLTTLVCFFTFMVSPMLAQDNALIFEMQLINEATQQPIPYANVRVLDENIGDVTDANGLFELVLPPDVLKDDTLIELTALGYAPRVVRNDFILRLLKEEKNFLLMEPVSTALSAPPAIKELSEDTTTYVQGTVQTKSGPLQGASVRVKGSLKEVMTNVDGTFRIAADSTDVLLISHFGMTPTEVSAENSNNLSITLESDGQLLNEVVVAGRKIETAYGEKNVDAVGYAASEITSEDIGAQYQSLDQLLVRLTGIQYSGVPGNRVYYFIRSVNSSITRNVLPVIVIDNQIYQQGTNVALPFVNVQNIDRITALPSLAASVKYGTLGSGGAIIINTKSMIKDDETINASGKRSMLVQGNDFNERLALYRPTSPFGTASNFEEARSAFETARTNTIDAGYYIESALYMSRWDIDYANNILYDLAEEGPNNVRLLRTIAYAFEANQQEKLATNFFQRILVLAPNSIQSYRDLANNYKETGEISKAYGLYKQMLVNETEGLDFEPLEDIVKHEIQQLVAFHRSEIPFQELPNDLLSATFKKDVRILMSYNDPQAEFDLQFVDPAKKYFIWKHDRFAAEDRIRKELAAGYAMEEFIIDDAPVGAWRVNLRQAGSLPENQVPVYVKYTFYKNFGTPTEKKTVKLVPLSAFDARMTLASFLNGNDT
ncbi:carboxypeptidase-like regulatory domain-containing protein [Altibacter sp. HG106]|uniref:carboxypeptidase-like regulatory domain-containing protein n=1 Tax=Altibacter sp. HG106 TaxID=3023937 RepID=UPI0023503537|nr:carboxypeptidase-like regulatory domain-containing protein [Altibacter sp. HG106]MDC7995083.1 carboxypeptidase-like regulatory domain-containing protein [Altibacter sp. HG106]